MCADTRKHSPVSGEMSVNESQCASSRWGVEMSVNESQCASSRWGVNSHTLNQLERIERSDCTDWARVSTQFQRGTNVGKFLSLLTSAWKLRRTELSWHPLQRTYLHLHLWHQSWFTFSCDAQFDEHFGGEKGLLLLVLFSNPCSSCIVHEWTCNETKILFCLLAKCLWNLKLVFSGEPGRARFTLETTHNESSVWF